MAVENGEIDLVKKLIKIKTQDNPLTCIQYALRQTNPTGRKDQFLAFRFLIEKLIIMRLPDQQCILDKLLQDYAIVYLSSQPEFTDYLLSVDALPKMPNKSGEFPVADALWAVKRLIY